MKWLATVLVFAACSAHAQSSAPAASPTPAPKRVGLDTSSNIRINYGRAAWNTSPEKIDSASILMREGSTGRTIQISLNETAPDSAIFSGLYQISFQNMQKLQTEFYIPDQAELEKAGGLKLLLGQIANGKLTRNPFILRRQPSGEQSVEIFDTKEQARDAMKAYKAEQNLASKASIAIKNTADQVTAAVAAAAELKAEQEKLAAEAERQRLAQIEEKRLADLQAAQAAASEAEKARRRQEAQLLSQEGLELFKKDDFTGAKEKFDKAMQLDPSNQQFYVQYGITLYRNEDFNRSLVILKLATDPKLNLVERDFYLGLNYFKTKEYASAVSTFDNVAKANDSSLSPSAEFYKGVIHYETRAWDLSRAAFQKVLDTSKDPKLDASAETYIDYIMRAQAYENDAKKKWFFNATIGEQYDSNVLLVADQAAGGTATNTKGLRTILSGSAKYRGIYEETRELAAQLDLTTMYTVDGSFQGQQSLRDADPNVLALSVPYTVKGTVFNGKAYKLDLSPGYESIYMSIENGENKEILASVLMNSNGLLVMSDTWFSTYGLDVRQENSKLTSSTGDDDSSSVKVKFSTTQMFMVGPDKKKIFMPDFAYTLNQAKGKNSVYSRMDLGLSYIVPWKWETSANFKLAYYNINYPQNASGRADNNFTLTAGLSRKLTEIWSTGFLATYETNQSNVTTNTYNKYTGLLTLSAAVGF